MTTEHSSNQKKSPIFHPDVKKFSDYLQSLLEPAPDKNLDFVLQTIKNTPIQTSSEFDLIVNNLASANFQKKISNLSFTKDELHSFFNFYLNCMLIRYEDKKNINLTDNNSNSHLFHKLNHNAQKKVLNTISTKWLTTLTQRLIETHQPSSTFPIKTKKELVKNYIQFLTIITKTMPFDLKNWRPETFTLIDLFFLTNKPELINTLNRLAKELTPHYLNIGSTPNGSTQSIALWHEKHIFNKHKTKELTNSQEKLQAYPYLYDLIVPVDLKTISYSIKSQELLEFSQQQQIKPLAIDFVDNNFKISPSLLCGIFLHPQQSSNNTAHLTFFSQTIENLTITNEEKSLPFPSKFAPSIRFINKNQTSGTNFLKDFNPIEIPLLYLAVNTNTYELNRIYDHNLFRPEHFNNHNNNLLIDLTPKALLSRHGTQNKLFEKNQSTINWSIFYSTQLADETFNRNKNHNSIQSIPYSSANIEHSNLNPTTLLPITHPTFEPLNFQNLATNNKETNLPISFDLATQKIIQSAYTYLEKNISLSSNSRKKSFFAIIDSYIDKIRDSNYLSAGGQNILEKNKPSAHNMVHIEKFIEHLMKINSNLSFLKTIVHNDNDIELDRKQKLAKLFSQIEQYNLSLINNDMKTTSSKQKNKAL